MLKNARARGFTLTEALVAIAIMVVGLAGSAALLLQTVRQERESGSRRMALRIATSMADQLRALRRPDGRAVLAITGIGAMVACAEHPPSCETERAAEWIRISWLADAAFSLPQGAAAGVGAPDPVLPEYLISIDWPAAGGGMERLRLPVTT
ncbi:MAG: Prepilin-type N-terminal cleavage/methylation protein [Steroidobacteraceae bacterium]|nr:Prepilin-type N-terminal cleavage/methylation protein [Steroidobacteraceae bacterium]